MENYFTVKELIRYVSYPNTNLTYFYSDGSNETFYKSLPQFNGVPDTPFWIYCVAAVVVAAIIVACLCYAKHRIKMTRKRSYLYFLSAI
jgi:hypothetical protein